MELFVVNLPLKFIISVFNTFLKTLENRFNRMIARSSPKSFGADVLEIGIT